MVKLSNPVLPERTELWEMVLETLRQAIISGELAPGTRLVETDLAKDLHVSRWPVRQAITRLEQEHLVVKYPNRGAYVIEFCIDDVHEIYTLRHLLEAYAARQGCGRMTSELETQLSDLVSELDSAVRAGDVSASALSDIEFHREIFRLAGSERLLSMWEVLVAPIHALLMIKNSRAGAEIGAGLAKSHCALLEALRGGDPDRAEAQVHRQLGRSERIVLDCLPRRGASSD